MDLEGYVQLTDYKMAYRAASGPGGPGRPLLLIHGFPLSKAMWQPQLDGLAQDAWLIAPDLRGFGASEPVEGLYSMDQQADDCLALLQALGVTQPVLVCGLSMGGYSALAFYRRHKAQVAGLILAATRAGADSAEGKANRDQSIAAARAGGAGAVAAAMLPKMLAPQTYAAQPELVARLRAIMESASVAGIAGAQQGMKERPDSSGLLPQIGVPTLILHGAADQLISFSEAEVMLEAIPQARLRRLPDAGHLLNLEQPDLFNQAVRDFCASIP